MSCISNEGLVVISDSRICNLKLGTSVGEEDYLWAMAPVVELEFACRGIGINVELGEEWKSFVGCVTVLVSFDVLDSGAYWKIVESVSNFIQNIPVWGKACGWGLIAG
jgi:hypothetical protein